jgi:CarD family transcriptional regulator
MSACLSFQIGERVVYPNQGVGTIENISARNFGPKVEKFYLLRLAANSLTVMVPFSHVGDIGLRKITRTTEIGRMIEYLAEGRCRNCSDWKDRFKINSEKMRTGGMLGLAEVLKSLLLQQKEKPLSFREKKMLDRARHMLITEVSISRSVPTETAAQILAKALGKSNLALPEAM